MRRGGIHLHETLGLVGGRVLGGALGRRIQPPGADQRGDDGRGQDQDDHAERDQVGDVQLVLDVPGADRPADQRGAQQRQQHLEAHEAQDRRQAQLEVVELVHHPGEQEVE